MVDAGSQLSGSPVAEEPSWFDEQTISALSRLATLPENWDSYGARPIEPWAIRAAIELLFAVMQETTPPPSVTPTNRGSVLLEWHTRAVDMEVEVLSPRTFDVVFEDLTAGTEWERTIGPDLSPLRQCLARLSL